MRLYIYDQRPTQMSPLFASSSGQSYFPGRYSEKKFENLFPSGQLSN
ncbi:MAG TPA: hypothetical protein VGC79_18390 [Polyangiaceae bacterium]